MNHDDEMKRHLKVVENLKSDDAVDPNDLQPIQVAALGLLRSWFPKKIPTDIERWSEIAYDDAVAALTRLNEDGYDIIKRKSDG
jgi:hypothetical protein